MLKRFLPKFYARATVLGRMSGNFVGRLRNNDVNIPNKLGLYNVRLGFFNELPASWQYPRQFPNSLQSHERPNETNSRYARQSRFGLLLRMSRRQSLMDKKAVFEEVDKVLKHHATHSYVLELNDRGYPNLSLNLHAFDFEYEPTRTAIEQTGVKIEIINPASPVHDSPTIWNRKDRLAR